MSCPPRQPLAAFLLTQEILNYGAYQGHCIVVGAGGAYQGKGWMCGQKMKTGQQEEKCNTTIHNNNNNDDDDADNNHHQ